MKTRKEDVEKQDCERKAFARLTEKLKRDDPRLPICILADSLYACEPVFRLCEGAKWEWLLRFKDGSIPSVGEEADRLYKEGSFVELEEKEVRYVNGVSGNQRDVNLVRLEEQDQKGERKTFQFLTSLRLSKGTAEEIGRYGRDRWKIENEGFHTQKKHRYYIGHVFSHDDTAMKNHYLLTQVADILMQLYEHGTAILKRLRCGIKEISSLLLDSICKRTLTEEDITKLREPIQIRFL